MNVFTIILFFLVSAISGAIPGQNLFSGHSQGTSPDSLQFVFKSGTDGYTCFRIPAIVTTTRGILLAFAEGRKGKSIRRYNF